VAEPTKVSFVLIPRFNLLTVTTMIEPMRIANYLAPDKLFIWDYRSAEPDLIAASNGLAVPCVGLDDAQAWRPDMVVVCGSWGAEFYHNAALFSWLRRQARQGCRLVGVELGVYMLARAGLLSGQRITTHWSMLAGIVEAFPDIEACEQLYTIGAQIMTCAGGTAGLDLMLQLVAQQSGEALAAEVANQVLHHPRRPPEGLQRSATGGLKNDVHPDVRTAMLLLEARIEDPLSVPKVCRELGVSQRRLERLFRRDIGCTIVQFAKLLRLQYARVLLSTTRMSIRDVSAACGFNSMSYFSLSFLETFGKKPSEYRQAWPDNEPAPLWPGTVYSFLQNGGQPKSRRAASASLRQRRP
jgi:transcriptional regulator GlxA family with amidase domain